MSEQEHTGIKLPAFASEREEADWWYDNREAHAERFLQAAKEGKVRVMYGLTERLARARGATIVELDAEHKTKAAELAKQKGLSLELYISELVSEALDRVPTSAA